jgi:hypothetical protein
VVFPAHARFSSCGQNGGTTSIRDLKRAETRRTDLFGIVEAVAGNEDAGAGLFALASFRGVVSGGEKSSSWSAFRPEPIA